MKMRSVAGNFSSWLAAAVVGAGVALLCAPHSGRRTRRMIGRKAHQYMQEAGEQMAEKTGDLYVRGKQAAAHTARRLRRKLSLAA